MRQNLTVNSVSDNEENQDQTEQTSPDSVGKAVEGGADPAKNANPAPAKATSNKKPKKNGARFVLDDAENMRAELAVNVSKLAEASNLNRETVKKVLAGEATQRVSCEKVVRGLKKLGHETVSTDNISEMDD